MLSVVTHLISGVVGIVSAQGLGPLRPLLSRIAGDVPQRGRGRRHPVRLRGMRLHTAVAAGRVPLPSGRAVPPAYSFGLLSPAQSPNPSRIKVS